MRLQAEFSPWLEAIRPPPGIDTARLNPDESGSELDGCGVGTYERPHTRRGTSHESFSP
jgi:hypothetical protein